MDTNALWQSVLILVSSIGVLSWTIIKGVLERSMLPPKWQMAATLGIGVALGELAHGLGVLSPPGTDWTHYLWAAAIGLLGGLVGLSGSSNDVSTIVTDPFKPKPPAA